MEAIINAVQEPPGLLMLCCVAPPTDIGVVDVLHEDQGLWMWRCSYLPIEGLIRLVFLIVCLVFLVGWPVADPHY